MWNKKVKGVVVRRKKGHSLERKKEGTINWSKKMHFWGEFTKKKLGWALLPLTPQGTPTLSVDFACYPNVPLLGKACMDWFNHHIIWKHITLWKARKIRHEVHIKFTVTVYSRTPPPSCIKVLFVIVGAIARLDVNGTALSLRLYYKAPL